MPREAFDRELQRLEDEMLAMASMVEEAIITSVDSLKRQDLTEARRVIARDRAINQKRFDIEADCLVAIATQQPMASDLRILAAILHNITELERIGDYAKGIARINLMIGHTPLIKPLIDIPRMAEQARSMLHQSMEAFVQRDVEQAEAIPEQDEIVDALYNQVYRELMTYVLSDPRNIDQVNYLLWAAHNLERTADRVTNICERVVFTVTGEMAEMNDEESGLEGLAG
jgi:phosphate transport system protein